MVTLILFFSIVAFIALQRLWEVKFSKQNSARLIAKGGVEHAHWQVIAMVVLHTLWLVSMCAEVVFLERPLILTLFVLSFAGLIIGQYLRIVGRKTLGERWSVKIIVLPGAPLVQSGLYRYVQHPIYVGVALEIACVPLLHTAYLTAIIFSILNTSLLFLRIRAEEKALCLR